MRRGIQVDLSEVNDSIAELEAKHDIDTENLEAGLGETQSNVEGLSNAAAAAADALSSLEDDIVALSNFAHECCETAESNIAALSEELAAIDTSSYIPQSEKSRFIVDLVEPFAIGAHADNAGRIDIFGTLRSPLGPLFDLGEPSNPWREVYAEGLTLSDTSNLKFTHFQGAEGDFNLDDVIEYAVSLVTTPDHPTTVSLERINEVSFNNGIVVKGDLIPYEENAGFPPLSRVGNLTYPFLEGHFTNLFAGNIYGLDEGGSTRRVLLEGDAAATPQWITDLQSDVNISGFNLDVDFTGPRGPAGADGADGADAVLPSWVASSQSAIPLSGFANDLVLTADSVAWENVLNKPTFFSGSYNDLTNTPTIPSLAGYATESWVSSQGFITDAASLPSWVATSQSAIPLSGFANDLVLTADNVEWADVLNKPTFFSGSYNDLTNTPTIPSLAGYATESWVSSQGFITDAASLPSWVATSQSAIPLSGFANDLVLTADNVEWADVLNKPTFFSGSYNDLTNTPTIPSLAGYATESWVSSQGFITEAANLPSWVATSQSAIPLSGFANDLVLTADSVAWENVLNKPTFFSGSYNDLTNTPTIPSLAGYATESWVSSQGFITDAASLPSWVATSQSAIPLSGFANDLVLTADNVEWADVLNKPTFFSGSYNDLTNTPTIPSLAGYATESWVSSQGFITEAASLPSWVATSQSAIPLSGFANDLVLTADNVEWADVLNKPTFFSGSYNDLTNTPTIPSLVGYATEAWVTSQDFGADADWASLSGRPLWTDKFIYTQNVGPQMYPTASENYDIVLLDSITPTTNDVYNLGQDGLRWKFVYAMSGRFATDIHVGEITNHARFTYNTASNLVSVSRPLLLPRSPEVSNEAATKGYVDAVVAGGGNHDHPEYEPAKFMKVVEEFGEFYIIPNYEYARTLDEDAILTLGTYYDYATESNNDDLRWTEIWAEDIHAYYVRAENRLVLGELVTNASMSYVKSIESIEFSKSIVPKTHDSLDLGKSDLAWKHVYATDIEVEDDIKIGNDIRFVDSSGNNVCRLKYHPDGCEVDGHMFPDGTREFDLGKAGDEWRDIYAQFATISGGASIGSLETPLLNVTGVMSLNGNKITQVGAPDTGTDVVNKSYIDTAIANVTIDWDNIGGETKPAIFKDEVDYNVSSETFIPALNYVYDLGTTSSRWGTLHAYGVNAYLAPINAFEGVDAKGKAIVDVAAPTDSADAANKAYVDAEVLNVQIRASLALGMLGFAHIRVDKLSETETNVSFRLSQICVTCNSADEYSSPTLRATVLKNASFPHTLGRTITATPASSSVGAFESTYTFANIDLDYTFADGYNAMAPVIKFWITRNATRAGIGMSATIAEHAYYHSTLTPQDVYF
eukprot:jgi/Tetstr1/443425/TSEL_031436.t1